MKNILYLSCHAILEYDECKLLSELGYNVRSIGSYTNPHSPGDPKRPPIMTMQVSDSHIQVSNRFHQDNLHQEHLDWADVILCSHMPDWILGQTEKLKTWNKPIIWRSIGQSSISVEAQIREMKFRHGDQIKIIRYSPNEAYIDQRGQYFSDGEIRFYKDEHELTHKWSKSYHSTDILFVTQAASRRGNHCHFDELVKYTDFNTSRVLLGPDNEDWTSATMTTACPSYERLLDYYNESKLFVYSGTVPASYTLAPMEAMMCGTPILTISKEWWCKGHEQWLNKDVFEMPELFPEQVIREPVEWDSLDFIQAVITEALNNNQVLQQMSEKSREVGLTYFSKNRAMQGWTQLLESL